MPIQFFLNQSGYSTSQVGAMPEEGIQGDFGEVFGLARSVDGSELDESEVARYIEAFRNTHIELCNKSDCDALPSSEELEEIWSRMLEEIKMQEDITPVTTAHRWELDDAKCEFRDEWVCEAVLYRGEVRVILPLYENSLKLISGEHEETNGQSRWHKITDVTEIGQNMQRLTIRSQFWRNGKKETSSIEVVLDHGKPIYQ